MKKHNIAKMEKEQNISSGVYELNSAQKKYLPLKRAIDVILSGGAIVILSPVLGLISLAIKLESPGPVLFKQQRIGKNKKLFEIWKFRSMKIDTPKDVPTHMLSDPDKYITKTGKFLRKTSLDELPQIFNIFKGEMSIIGPRPALWNQNDLIAERDKYGANSVTPGLTGWAQINGRDELEIPVKAKLDGEYIAKLGFGMDVKCFLGTIGSVLCSDGVVEGGTGEMHKEGAATNGILGIEKLKKEIYTGAAVVGAVGVVVVSIIMSFIRWLKKRPINNTERKKDLGFKMVVAAIAVESFATVYTNLKRRVRMADDFVEEETEVVDIENGQEKIAGAQKKLLITGAGSYIGTSVEKWLLKYPERYQIDTLDMQDENWRDKDFSEYDVIYHVAGIAHADVGAVSKEQEEMYYKVNTDLAIETAKKAKTEGVKQFIFMSSMIIYSGCKEKIIHEDTKPKPLNFYGDSKLQADDKIKQMASESFRVVILRPPMIYGKDSKGNYPELAKLAAKLPVFPIVNNKRSMLHIDNLCAFVKLMIDNEESGVFFPQNREYTNTSDMVQLIADVKGHRIIMIPGFSAAVRLLGKMPGKIGSLAAKAFGDSAYDMQMSEYKENYRVNSLRKSIELTEGTEE